MRNVCSHLVKILRHHHKLEAQYNPRLYHGHVDLVRPSKSFETILREADYWSCRLHQSKVSIYPEELYSDHPIPSLPYRSPIPNTF